LFNPRIDEWHDHFNLVGARIEGRTTSGRVTVSSLRMNTAERIDVRQRLISIGHSEIAIQHSLSHH
jgi:hypothetical protein